MYRYLIPTRILFAIGTGLLVFSLVFGWVSFAVPDWLQFYEGNGLKNQSSSFDQLNDLKKFGLWFKCLFVIQTNDFTCLPWNNNTPSFVRVAQVLIPIGLAFSCLALLTACSAFICTRAFITTVLFAALFSFLSFVFVIIGVTVFANESVVYVERLRVENNEYPRRWGMWLLVPNLALSFLTSICFIVASILNWCDYRSMEVSGILSHSVGKLDGSVCKLPSDSNTISALKKQYQDYPNACYQLNGLNNNNQQQTGHAYPSAPTYSHPGYQATAPNLFGYSRATSPTMNPMYPYSNYESSSHPRHYMTENSDIDELTRSNHSRRHSRSRPRSRSRSPLETTTMTESNPKQTQFVPIPVPYYQPVPMTSNNTNSQPVSYLIPQNKQQFVGENNQTISKGTNVLKYGTVQPSVVVSNPTPPVYTIAYRANNPGNILTGPAATTYVATGRNPTIETHSFSSDSDNEHEYRKPRRRKHLKKININEAWTWRQMH